MRSKIKIMGLTILFLFTFKLLTFILPAKTTMPSEYRVQKLNQTITIDANWDKPEWQNVNIIEFKNHMGELPSFVPSVQAKMMYDDENLYVIFNVHDRYVSCKTMHINGPVWEDSCVEFFFSPDEDLPERYFNLEINCGGTPLMHYNIIPRKEFIRLDVEDIKKIEIAHSMPRMVYPEITEPVVWTIEYKLPITMLQKYSKVTYPEKGVRWKGNFYKIADKTSNPHYLTWTVVDNPVPDFHLPSFFGGIIFD
jgi:hypothetical protein